MDEESGLMKIITASGKIALFPVAGFLPNYVQRFIYGNNILPWLTSSISVPGEFYISVKLMQKGNEGGDVIYLLSGFFLAFFSFCRAMAQPLILYDSLNDWVGEGTDLTEGGSIGSAVGAIPGEIIGQCLLKSYYKKNKEQIKKGLHEGRYWGREYHIYKGCVLKDEAIMKEKNVKCE